MLRSNNEPDLIILKKPVPLSWWESLTGAGMRLSAKYGLTSVVEYLLTMDVAPSYEMLVIAIENGSVDVAHTLLNHLNLAYFELKHAQNIAQESGHAELVLLIENKLINLNDENGLALLHHAVYEGDVEEVKRLIGKGADVNAKSVIGRPLYIAASPTSSYFHKYNCIAHHFQPQSVYIEIIKILLEHGAKPNKHSFGFTAMQAAGIAGEIPAFNLLLPITQKTNEIMLRRHFQPGALEIVYKHPWYAKIMHTATHGEFCYEILSILLQEGADLNFPREDGSTLLSDVIDDLLGCPFRMNDGTKRKEWLSDKYKLLLFLLDNGASPSPHINDTALEYVRTDFDKFMKSLHASKSTKVPENRIKEEAICRDKHMLANSLTKMMRASAGELTQDDLLELNRPATPVISVHSSYYHSDDSDSSSASPSFRGR